MFNDLNCSFLMEQNDPFESALSSMVSSPTASNNNNGENIILRELIGRLGSICNSANTSCYTTPLNSPPKLNLLSANQFLSLPTLSSDPGFAERAARLSCLSAKKVDLPSTAAVQENWESTDSRENSMVSDQIFPAAPNTRKRKPSAPKGKAKEATPAPYVSENIESSAKRSKSEEEPPKDYIHVRARRGQATDAHSLAERVRREKISERMKVLQDLVPGCNKVTGKAVMLDEIINYVQSLQRQVEFLSMKLATVYPRMEAHMGKLDMFQSRGSSYTPDSYPFQSPNNLNPAAAGRMDSFGDAASQVSSFWEDDLHSIVQMGFGQSIQGIQMKVEL